MRAGGALILEARCRPSGGWFQGSEWD